MTEIFHYTSLDTFTKIIESQSLRLYSLTFMNDSQELLWFLDLAREKVLRRAGESRGNDQQYFNALAEWLKQRKLAHVYAMCFSKSSDDLNQWVRYADDARGVCIGMNPELVEREANSLDANQPPLEVVKVVYAQDIKQQHVDNIIEKWRDHKVEGPPQAVAIIRAAMCYQVLMLEAPRFKNTEFESESEVRLVVAQTGHDNAAEPKSPADALQDRADRVGYQFRNNMIVPYVSIPLPVEAITKVVLGTDGADLEQTTKWFLSKYGIEAAVESRKSSYRRL